MIRPKTNHSTRGRPLNELGQWVEAAGAISRLGNTRDKAAKQARGTIGIDGQSRGADQGWGEPLDYFNSTGPPELLHRVSLGLPAIAVFLTVLPALLAIAAALAVLELRKRAPS
jgi:hypothetical protein